MRNVIVGRMEGKTHKDQCCSTRDHSRNQDRSRDLKFMVSVLVLNSGVKRLGLGLGLGLDYNTAKGREKECWTSGRTVIPRNEQNGMERAEPRTCLTVENWASKQHKLNRWLKLNSILTYFFHWLTRVFYPSHLILSSRWILRPRKQHNVLT